MEVEVEVQFGLKRSALPEELLGLFDGRVALPKGTVSVPSIPQRSILLTFAGFGLGLLVAGLLSLQSYFFYDPETAQDSQGTYFVLACVLLSCALLVMRPTVVLWKSRAAALAGDLRYGLILTPSALLYFKDNNKVDWLPSDCVTGVRKTVVKMGGVGHYFRVDVIYQDRAGELHFTEYTEGSFAVEFEELQQAIYDWAGPDKKLEDSQSG